MQPHSDCRLPAGTARRPTLQAPPTLSSDFDESISVDGSRLPRALDYRKISSYSLGMPRRKPGTLLPLEADILEVALLLVRSGHVVFHGFGLARTMREQGGSRSLTAHGTLYKALSRLEEFGLLTSRWEDPAAAEGRPRRRLYELTSQGVRAAERSLAGKAARRPPRLASEPA